VNFFGDLLPIIFWTHPMFSGVYGKIDHVLNGLDRRALKKDRDRPIVDIRDRGSGQHGIWGSRPHGIGGLWRIMEGCVLNSLSALSILTTIAQLFQTNEVAV
jgi:hypothetical protein